MKAVFRTSVNLDIPKNKMEAAEILLGGIDRAIKSFAIHNKVTHYDEGTTTYDMYLDAPDDQIDRLNFCLRSFALFATKPFIITSRLDGKKWTSETIYVGKKENLIDPDLEARMEIIQRYISLGLNLRNQSKIRIKQPLAKMIVRTTDDVERKALSGGELTNMLLDEINVKEIELIEDASSFYSLTHKINFKTLGPKYKKLLSLIKHQVEAMNSEALRNTLDKSSIFLEVMGESLEIEAADVVFERVGVDGYITLEERNTFAALDINITPELYAEGIMRDFVRAVQEQRKAADFDISDRITIIYDTNNNVVIDAINTWFNYINKETLSNNLCQLAGIKHKEVKVGDEKVRISVGRTRVRIAQGLNAGKVGMILGSYSDGKIRLRIDGKDCWAYESAQLKSFV